MTKLDSTLAGSWVIFIIRDGPIQKHIYHHILCPGYIERLAVLNRAYRRTEGKYVRQVYMNNLLFEAENKIRTSMLCLNLTVH